MILFLYGKDTYRLQQKLREIENRYREIHKTGLNLEKLDANQISFREFWDKLFQQSMFIKKKLFFLENVFSNQKFKEQFTEKIKEISGSEDIVVLFEKKELAGNDETFKALKKYGKSQEFKPLEGKKLREWIEKGFQKYEAEITEEGIDKLIEFVGNDLWQLSNEIKKLSFFKRTAIASHLKNCLKTKVEREDVEKLVTSKIETDIFKTIDALAQRDKKRAFRFIENHLEKGDNPLYLLKMINFQFRNLLFLKLCQLKGEWSLTSMEMVGKNFGIHPYVVKKSMRMLGNFSLEELKKIYQKIFETDLEIKTGKISPQEGIRMLIAKI